MAFTKFLVSACTLKTYLSHMILGSQLIKVNRHGQSLENAKHWQISLKTREFAFKNSYLYQSGKKGIVFRLNYNFKYHCPLENISIAWKITFTYSSHFWSLEWHFLISICSVLFLSSKVIYYKKSCSLSLLS